MKDLFQQAIEAERRINELMQREREPQDIKELVTKFEFKPVQTLIDRYEYVKMSRNEKNLDYFKKIAETLADSCFTYYVQDREDEYECCVCYGNDAYDFELILSLARFYQKNETLFDGHIDVIKRYCKAGASPRPCWNNLKNFWLDLIS